MKQYLKYIISVIILIVLGLLIFFITRDKVETKNFSDEYTSVPKDNLFVYRDKDEIIKILKNGIHLKDVSFGYEDDKDILKNINVFFEAGKSYAIVGGSGSGKSTLLNLLMAGSNKYRGNIEFDNTDLKDVNSDSLYGMISMIQQNVFVFDASIRENVTMFRNFPKPDLDNAISRAHLSELLDTRGDDYRCGENGKGLSGGEKQRISIARSLLRKSSVLLVDGQQLLQMPTPLIM